MLRLFRYSLQAVIFSVLTLLELNQENVTLTFARVFCLALVGEGDLWYPVPNASFSLIAVGIGFSLPAWLLFVWYCLRMVALLAHSAALGCSQSPSIIAHHF